MANAKEKNHPGGMDCRQYGTLFDQQSERRPVWVYVEYHPGNGRVWSWLLSHRERCSSAGCIAEQKLILVHRVDTYKEFDITWKQIRELMYMIVEAKGAS